jgi:hypothetical protein
MSAAYVGYNMTKQFVNTRQHERPDVRAALESARFPVFDASGEGRCRAREVAQDDGGRAPRTDKGEHYAGDDQNPRGGCEALSCSRGVVTLRGKDATGTRRPLSEHMESPLIDYQGGPVVAGADQQHVA